MSDKEQSATALEKLRSLIEAKTRFSPDVVQESQETVISQPFRIDVAYELEACVEHQEINGASSLGDNYVEVADPSGSAHQERGARLDASSALLRERLGQLAGSYDAIAAGLFLPAESKYWHLDPCYGCGGKGQHTCSSCEGAGFKTCYSCHGQRLVTCQSCFGSTKMSCPSCGGSGSISRQVPYQVNTQVWDQASGQYHHSYHTEYRYETSRCSACLYGQVNCSRCSGTGRHNCTVCHGTGKAACSGCGGSGGIKCSTCDGSRKIGSANWVNVMLTPGYQLVLPDAADPTAQAVNDQDGLKGLATQAAYVTLGEFRETATAGGRNIVAAYNGALTVSYLRASCNGSDYQLVAYGKDLKWLSADGLLESLLINDLETLQQRIAAVRAEEGGAAGLDEMVQGLKDVVTSELNLDLIDAAVSPAGADDFRGVVSADYTERVKAAFLDAMRLAVEQKARQTFWWPCIPAGVLGLITWLFGSSAQAGLVAALVAVAGWLVFRHQLGQSLGEALGGEEIAKRAIAIAQRGKCVMMAYAMVVGPALLLAAGLYFSLPDSGPWKNFEFFPSASTSSQQ